MRLIAQKQCCLNSEGWTILDYRTHREVACVTMVDDVTQGWQSAHFPGTSYAPIILIDKEKRVILLRFKIDDVKLDESSEVRKDEKRRILTLNR